MWDVQQCACCGRVQPGNVDPTLPSKGPGVPFERQHLVNKYHKGWRCTCSDPLCSGEQFYCRTNMKQYYEKTHGASVESHDLASEVVLCKHCFYEVEPMENKLGRYFLLHLPSLLFFLQLAISSSWCSLLVFSELNLKTGYKFSLKNGFGPIPKTHTLLNLRPDACQYTQMSHMLHHLLSSLTPVEEAAIRRVCPLLSVVKLSYGNLGSKGNVSCVFQDSKLGTILPNLPTKYKFIVVMCNAGTSSEMVSMKFSRSKIEVVLKLLKLTGTEAWRDIEIFRCKLKCLARIWGSC